MMEVSWNSFDLETGLLVSSAGIRSWVSRGRRSRNPDIQRVGAKSQ